MEKKNYIVAIDLGSSDVVVAVGSRDADGKIMVEGIAVKESKGVVRGEVKNVEQAAQSIKEAVSEVEEKLGIKIAEAYTGISGSHIKCAKHPYYVYVSGADGEIFEEDVRRLNESMRGVQAPDGYQLMHIIPQHYLVDDDEEVADPVGMFGKTLGSTFNLIIGENTIISRLDKALSKVGIKQKKLFINPLAMAEAVTFPDEKDLGVAVVDLGAGTTDLCIYHDGIVRYVGVIPLGADSINKDIRSYGIMERYVEELKVKYGSAVAELVDSEKLVKVPGRTPNDHKEISFRNLASIIEARIQDIVDYIVEEIKAAGYEGKLGAGIILTGGCAQLKEIKKLVEDRTGLDVRIALPDILVSEDSKDSVADPRFSAAVGILNLGAESGLVTHTEHVEQKRKVVAPASENETVFQPVRKPVYQSEDENYDQDEFLEEERVRPEDKTKEKRQKTKTPKRGFMQKIKERFEKTFDFDVLDDDNTI